MGEIPNRQNWHIVTSGNGKPILKNKEELIRSYIAYMLARTQRMVEYEDLPDTIPAREFELLLQISRFAIITKVDDKLFAFFGGLGGIPNTYYQPTKAYVSNPYLKYFDTLDIDQYDQKEKNGECVIIWNDSLHYGLLPMFEKYASLIAECDISLRVGVVNARIPAFFKASNDTVKTSIEEMINHIEDGELFVVGDELEFGQNQSQLVESFNNGESAQMLKNVMEVRQYLLGNWLNEIGLNANYNMKREAINESEADLNEDALLPLVDDLLYNRKKGWDKVNELFGTKVKVKLSSSWLKIHKEVEKPVEEKNDEAKDVTEEDKDEKVKD